MSTRSMIAIENKDGSLDAIYCHSDGYLSYVGFILYTFYDTPEKVRALINLGALSWIGYGIGKPFDMNKVYTEDGFYDTVKKQCAPYYGCTKETKKEIRHYKSRNSLYKGGGCWIEYVYIFRDGEWYVKYEKVDRLSKLETQLKTEAKKDLTTRRGFIEDYDTYTTEAEAEKIFGSYKKLGFVPENAKFKYEPKPLF